MAKIKNCKIEGCEGKHEGLGYCRKHYCNFKKYGNPIKLRGPIDIFQSFLTYLYPVSDGCWFWTGSLNSKGYGTFEFNGKKHLVHRISYMHFKGPIDIALEVMHICDIRNCINPEHLILGTHQENIQDMVNKKRNVVGIKSPSAKLTEDQVIQIKRKLKNGIKISIIVKEYKVAPNTIAGIRDEKYWKHIRV